MEDLARARPTKGATATPIHIVDKKKEKFRAYFQNIYQLYSIYVMHGNYMGFILGQCKEKLLQTVASHGKWNSDSLMYIYGQNFN